jgi:two-component system nitrogen regulation sensor histidine kinase NtrY
MMRIGHHDIAITAELPEAPIYAEFDRRLISQSVTNIVKMPPRRSARCRGRARQG